ncbi:MAG: tetratricopeptide repeat protein [Spirochaetales bacterium]|nr:tetratricopeptide repeat protein [Spirochaetales bacterium]
MEPNELNHNESDQNEQPTKPMRKGTKWLLRAGLAIGIPVLFLLLLEIILNAAGIGYPTDFFMKSQINGKEYFIENQKYTYRFFPKILARPCIIQALPVKKEVNAFRIFVMGESAARGEPNPSFSFTRILMALLEPRYPEIKFEISNTAIAAVNSHALFPIAENCTSLSPDLYIIYAGNNEVIGPYGPSTVFTAFSQNLSLIRFGLSLKSLRTGQIIQDIIAGFSGQGAVPEGWAGLKMFMEHKIRKTDPRMQGVYDMFYENIRGMTEAGIRAQAPVILCTVTSNLKDCAPFASLHREDLADSDKTKWEEYYDAGISCQQNSEWEKALADYRKAEAVDQTYAELLYRMGECLYNLENYTEALAYYKKSMEMDTLRFRADEAINTAVRKIAGQYKSEGVYLSDIENLFFESSPHNIPGQSLFFEHVHMNFSGNYLIARSLLDSVDAVLAQKGIARASGAVLTEEECRQRLVLTGWELYGMYNNMLSMIRTAPFTNQLNNAGVVRYYEDKIKELEEAIQYDKLQEASELYKKEISEHGDDCMLRKNYGLLFSDALGDSQNAQIQFNEVLYRHPHDYIARINLGTAYSRMAKNTEAVSEYREALKYDSENPVIYTNIGVAYHQLGKQEEALAAYDKALSLSPDSPETQLRAAEVLLSINKMKEAVLRADEAIKLRPNSVDMIIQAGSVMSKQKYYDKAFEYYNKALQMDKNSVEAHRQIGVTYFNTQDYDRALFHFSEILTIAPEMTQVRKYIAQIYENQGNLEKAAEFLSSAIAIDPEDMQALSKLAKFNLTLKKPEDTIKVIHDCLKKGAHENSILYLSLGEAYLAVSKLKAATESFDKAISFQDNNLNLYNQIGLILARGGRVEASLNYFERALALDPDFFEARNNVAFAYYKLDRPREAIKHYLFVIKARPNMTEVHLVLGNLFLKIKDGENAAVHFREYLKVRPNDGKGIQGLKDALTLMNK